MKRNNVNFREVLRYIENTYRGNIDINRVEVNFYEGVEPHPSVCMNFDRDVFSKNPESGILQIVTQAELEQEG